MNKITILKEFRKDHNVRFTNDLKLKSERENDFWEWFNNNSNYYNSNLVKWENEGYSEPFNAKYGYCHINSLRLNILYG